MLPRKKLVTLYFMTETKEPASDPVIDALFKVGAHYGYAKTRRHPSTASYILGLKNRVEIINLEQTKELLEAAKVFVKTLGAEGKIILFVGGKHEAADAVRQGAMEIGMPNVSGRWIGGTLTNFAQIRSRVDMLLDLKAKREQGDLAKYTKKEQLLISRDIEKLEELFGGLVGMKALPAALFIVDPKEEKTAASEAKRLKIPVVALASSDCDISDIAHPIIANDSSMGSIRHFVNEIVKAYNEGKITTAKV
ncbi:MAG: small subunit ribosomal protein S2 [Parcubacteria group bacterium Gr01-1014_17]|nr:MAG: small subunit ribosomal protein S2 [Parcubacteria group bacterium Gr01-1014_17]